MYCRLLFVWYQVGATFPTRFVSGGADGFEVYVSQNSDYDGGRLFYGSYQLGSFYRIDSNNNFSDIAGGGGTGANAEGNWETPLYIKRSSCLPLFVNKNIKVL